MSRLAVCALLLLPLFSASGAEKAKINLRVFLEANINDSDVFSTKMTSPTTGKQIVIEKVARISERDVLAFYPYQGGEGTFGALLKLDAHGTLMLDTMSVERRGAMVYFFVNGRPVAEEQIDKHITDGKLYIPSGLTQADLALMAKEWRVLGRAKKKK